MPKQTRLTPSPICYRSARWEQTVAESDRIAEFKEVAELMPDDPVVRFGLAGAYLDVFEREPLDPASPLWDMPNVIVSPHTASHSLGQNEAIFDIFLDNLTRFRNGAGLRNDVDNLA